MDLAWDQDIAEAFRLALAYGRSDVFNLAGGGPISAEEMGRLSGKPVTVLPHGPSMLVARMLRALGIIPEGQLDWVREMARWPILVSSERARERLGWKPRLDSAGAYLEFLARRGKT